METGGQPTAGASAGSGAEAITMAGSDVVLAVGNPLGLSGRVTEGTTLHPSSRGNP